MSKTTLFFYKKSYKTILCVILFFVTKVFGEPVSGFEDQKTQEMKVPQINLIGETMERIERILPSYDGEYFVILKTGLTLLVKEIDYSPVVTCKITVNSGSVNEEEFLGAGISHYLEHVVSGGTTSIRSEKENQEILKELGGASNASTSYDKTMYFINTTPEKWKTAAELLFSYITQCTFEQSEIDREKPVILQEFKLGQNNPDRQLWYLFSSTAFAASPLKYPVIGYETLFKSLTRQDLLAYYKKRYQPQNIVFTVVGNISGEQVLRDLIELTKNFHPTYTLQIPLLREEEQLIPRWAEQIHPAARVPSMKIGFPTVSLMDNDLYPLDVLAIILGSGRTSRLYKALKDDEQLALSVSALSWTPPYERGSFIFSATLEYDKIKPAIGAIKRLIEQIRTDGVTQEELDRAKKKIIADHIFSNQRVSDIAENLTYSYLVSGSPHFADQYVENIQNVTFADIKRVAQNYFKDYQQTTAIIKPPINENIVNTHTKQKTGDLPAHKFQLNNGMKVIFKSVPEYPLVDFRLFLNGGLRYETSGKEGISSFTANMLMRGTSSKSKQEISRIIEDRGGKLSSGSGQNAQYALCSMLSEDGYIGLEILADIIKNPSFPEDELEKQREDTLLAIDKKNEQWESELFSFFKQHYFSDHPYKNDELGTAESVAAFTRDDLATHHKALYVPNNMVLAVYGSFDENMMKQKIQELFGALSEQPLPQLELQTEVGQNIVSDDMVVEKVSDKYSVSLLLGFPGMTLFDPDKPAMDIVDAVISGIQYPSGWLQESLRGNDKSLVYFVHAFPRFGIDGGFFAIMSQTTQENYQEVHDIIRETVNRIQNEAISQEELELAKNMCITMHKMNLETPAAQSYSAALNELIGLGYDYDDSYPSLIEKVTVDDVMNAARKYMSKSLLATIYPPSTDEQSDNDGN